MAKVSVLIPSRNEMFLARTVEEVFSNAAGEVECLVHLDGYWPDPPLAERPGLRLLHSDEPLGNVHGVNAMAAAATGKYLMKLDAHCMLAPGYDEALQVDCDYEWLAVPARYQLIGETWQRGRGPIHYLYVTHPYIFESQFGWGMHGKKWQGPDGLGGEWYWPERHWTDRLIDDIMAMQGSLWFMHRQRFLDLGGYDIYFYHFQEPQAIGLKVWLSDKGRCIRNKKTWYAHLHKGKNWGRGYRLSKHKADEDVRYSADFWMHDRWANRARDMQWFVEKFWPIPGWPEDWDNPRYEQEYMNAKWRGR